MVDQADSIRAHGLRYLHERVCAEHSMLIVDDVAWKDDLVADGVAEGVN
mgnify:CR=1 FL=1